MKPWSNFELKPRYLDVLACLLIFLAFIIAVHTTFDLDWPPRWDFFRELGSINAILDGQRGKDPLYLNESIWYNPLLPELVAFSSTFFDLDIHSFFTRAGAYFNLLVPITFYLFIRGILSPLKAVCALAIFLFWLPSNLPVNTFGVYSPWLWPRNFAIGLFFLTAFSFLMALKYEQRRWEVISGIFLGLTFLTHTAPALILALAILVFCCWQYIVDKRISQKTSPTEKKLSADSTKNNARLIGLFVVGGTSLLVSLPYLSTLLIEYKLNMLNTAPIDYSGIKLKDAIRGAFTLRFTLSLLGLYAILFKVGNLPVKPKCFLLVCFFTTVVLFCYGMVFSFLLERGIKLIQVVPAYHFHMYIKCFEAVFAAMGIFYSCNLMIERLRQQCWFESHTFTRFLTTDLLSAAIVFMLLIINLPHYLHSADLQLFRQESLKRADSQHLNQFYDWARSETDNDDVFLADNFYSLFAVSPTARKVVAIYDVYSNPYVDFDLRDQARAMMFNFLRQGKYDEFMVMAKQNQVTYVFQAEDADKCCQLKQLLPENLFKPVFTKAPISVYRINYTSVRLINLIE